MSRPAAVVIPIRQPHSRRIDLALALAMLSKGVKAHEMAMRRARLAVLRGVSLRMIDGGFARAKSLGA